MENLKNFMKKRNLEFMSDEEALHTLIKNYENLLVKYNTLTRQRAVHKKQIEELPKWKKWIITILKIKF